MAMDGNSIWGSRDYQVPQYFNFADVIDDWAAKEKLGDKVNYNPALWWSDGEGQEVKWSFQDLASISKRAANVLSTVANITSGERVMVLVPRIPEYWLMQVACLRTGAILVPVPTNIGCAELQRRIFLIKPSCFVSNGVIENNLLDTIDEFSSSTSAVKCRLMFNRMKESNRDSWLSFDDLLQQASSHYQSVNSLSSAPIAIVFTSGTTGNAKMVEHSHGSWGLQNRTGMDRLGMGIIESDLVWSQSGTGWVILLAMAMSSWSVGAGVFAHYRNLNAREALEILVKFPITFTFLLPSIYINAVKEDLRSFHFSKLSSCMTTGEPVDKEVMLKWKEATGIDIRNIYGQTEAVRTVIFGDYFLYGGTRPGGWRAGIGRLSVWARLLTLSVPLYQEYKWVPGNCQGNQKKCCGVTCDGLASPSGGVTVILVASCFRNQDKLRQKWATILHIFSQRVDTLLF